MDKNKIMLSILMSVLSEEYRYRPTQLSNAMGDKYETFLSWAENASEANNEEIEKVIYELFLEYVNLL